MKWLRFHDYEDDASLRMLDGGPRRYGVDLFAQGMAGTEAVLCVDKRILLRWCERVAAHLRAQGVKP